MKSTITKWLSILYILIFICSCEEEIDYFYIRPELKDWGYYEEGSYWIYQNDSTLAIDSIYITSTLCSRVLLFLTKKYDILVKSLL